MNPSIEFTQYSAMFSLCRSSTLRCKSMHTLNIEVALLRTAYPQPYQSQRIKYFSTLPYKRFIFMTTA